MLKNPSKASRTSTLFLGGACRKSQRLCLERLLTNAPGAACTGRLPFEVRDGKERRWAGPGPDTSPNATVNHQATNQYMMYVSDLTVK